MGHSHPDSIHSCSHVCCSPYQLCLIFLSVEPIQDLGLGWGVNQHATSGAILFAFWGSSTVVLSKWKSGSSANQNWAAKPKLITTCVYMQSNSHCGRSRYRTSDAAAKTTSGQIDEWINGHRAPVVFHVQVIDRSIQSKLLLSRPSSVSVLKSWPTRMPISVWSAFLMNGVQGTRCGFNSICGQPWIEYLLSYQWATKWEMP